MLCFDNGSPNTIFAANALNTRFIAPIGARITIGKYPIEKMDPIVLAKINDKNANNHIGRLYASLLSSRGNRSFKRCDFR